MEGVLIEGEGLLAQRELESLALGAAGRPQGVTEAELVKIVAWASDVRLAESLLALVLRGLVTIQFVGDDPEPKFSVIP